MTDPQQIQDSLNTLDAFKVGIGGLQGVMGQVLQQLDGQPPVALKVVDQLIGAELEALHDKLGQLLALLRPKVTAKGGDA